MKKYFTTGLALLLPVLLTILIVGFFVNLVTQPFLGSIESIVANLDFFKGPFLIFNRSDLITFFSKALILLGLIFAILLVGVIGKLFLVDYFFKLTNVFFHKIPYFNKIYKGSQDIVHGLFSTGSKAFSQVVLVPFPTAETLSVGLVTKESIPLNNSSNPSELIPVFVPGTPNPSVGFLLMFKQNELVSTDMKVDDALKFIVSCGVVMPEFSVNSLNKKTEPL
jgi:uncharacterized membrane protein